jgi:hypothetical protein
MEVEGAFVSWFVFFGLVPGELVVRVLSTHGKTPCL